MTDAEECETCLKCAEIMDKNEAFAAIKTAGVNFQTFAEFAAMFLGACLCFKRTLRTLAENGKMSDGEMFVFSQNADFFTLLLTAYNKRRGNG